MARSRGVPTPARLAVLETVARAILDLPADRVTRVGIDGVDGAGKTSFADELAETLDTRPVIRAGVDGFHNPRNVRYRRGRRSPDGFYRDSYDYAALRTMLLEPLSPEGSGRFRRAVFDVDADSVVEPTYEVVAPGSILLFDGIFLHRPELRSYWDYSIFLRVDWDRNHRARHRTADDFGPADPRNERYRGGQEIYFRECRPWTLASVVIDNDDLEAPFIVASTNSSQPR